MKLFFLDSIQYAYIIHWSGPTIVMSWVELRISQPNKAMLGWKNFLIQPDLIHTNHYKEVSVELVEL